MGYAPRPDVRGATYHIGTRGTNKETIFFDDNDRAVFLGRLAKIAARHGWVILAYCLMTNHYHVVLRVPLGGLSRGMQWLHTSFSRRTNLRQGRTMHLFRQRFFSELIESDEQLYKALRYVVLNPCRARVCRTPDEWPWSSYRASAGIEPPPSFLAVTEVTKLFGRDVDEARTAYRRFVYEGLVQDGDGDYGHGQVSDTVTEM